MKKFRCYILSVEVYSLAQSLSLPSHLKRQLLRAASSIVLNFGEGWGRESQADRRHFFTIAFGSIRECQSIAELGGAPAHALKAKLDVLAGSAWRLLHPK